MTRVVPLSNGSHTFFSRLIDAFKANMAGNQAGYQEQLVEVDVNIHLFYDEHDRVAGCVPECEP